jgi:hypothetical protein
LYSQRNIKISQPTLARQLAYEHSKAILNVAWGQLALHLDMDHLAVQVEVELATWRNAQAAPDLDRNDDLALLGNGDGLHFDLFLLLGRKTLSLTPHQHPLSAEPISLFWQLRARRLAGCHVRVHHDLTDEGQGQRLTQP